MTAPESARKPAARRRFRVAAACLCASLAGGLTVAAGGCQDGPQRADNSRQAAALRREQHALFNNQPSARNTSRNSPDAKPAAADAGWSVVLAVFRGDGRAQAARIVLQRIKTEGGLPGAYVQDRETSTVVAYGDYEGPETDTAQADLKRIQQMKISGVRPYWFAFLSPPPEQELVGSRPEYNLLQARAQFGANAMYTLQVAVYGRDDLKYPTEDDLKEARKAAEDAAAKLRQEGELAFYYHGPRRSMVTIGVFDKSDFDPEAPTIQSDRLREARKRHPYNLYNGQGIRVSVPGRGEGQLQPSGLVRIPER